MTHTRLIYSLCTASSPLKSGTCAVLLRVLEDERVNDLAMRKLLTGLCDPSEPERF